MSGVLAEQFMQMTYLYIHYIYHDYDGAACRAENGKIVRYWIFPWPVAALYASCVRASVRVKGLRVFVTSNELRVGHRFDVSGTNSECLQKNELAEA
nr:hypothetical protein CFP56_67024 [Quercus suber]